MKSITAFGLPDFPLVKPGDDLVKLIVETMASAGDELRPDDVVVVAQKIVSKAEGRLVRIGDVTPTQRSIEIAEKIGKDPRAVEIILSDANEIIRMVPGLLIVEQNSGWICANGGVDRSNIEPNWQTPPADTTASETSPESSSPNAPAPQRYDDDEVLALLPVNADASATHLRKGLAAALGIAENDAPAVIITDSHGRAWRSGIVGICIGCAGIAPVWDQRGRYDLFGYELHGSEEAIADELAATAGLLMGASNEGLPVVIIRGYQLPANTEPAPAKSMQRPKEKDLFR